MEVRKQGSIKNNARIKMWTERKHTVAGTRPDEVPKKQQDTKWGERRAQENAQTMAHMQRSSNDIEYFDFIRCEQSGARQGCRPSK